MDATAENTYVRGRESDLAEAINLLRSSLPIFENGDALADWHRRWAVLVGRHTQLDDE